MRVGPSIKSGSCRHSWNWPWSPKNYICVASINDFVFSHVSLLLTRLLSINTNNTRIRNLFRPALRYVPTFNNTEDSLLSLCVCMWWSFVSEQLMKKSSIKNSTELASDSVWFQKLSDLEVSVNRDFSTQSSSNSDNFILKMKFFIVLFAVIAAALAAPQFGGGFGGGGFGGSAANAGASSQTFK